MDLLRPTSNFLPRSPFFLHSLHCCSRSKTSHQLWRKQYCCHCPSSIALPTKQVNQPDIRILPNATRVPPTIARERPRSSRATNFGIVCTSCEHETRPPRLPDGRNDASTSRSVADVRPRPLVARSCVSFAHRVNTKLGHRACLRETTRVHPGL